MVCCLLLATLPMALALPFDTAVEALASHTKAVGLLLMANGLCLLFTDRFAARQNQALTPTRALTVGFCHLCAILPGLSRSGATVSGGRLCGFSREFAVRFSFLLSIPAILGANLMRLPALLTDPPVPAERPAYLAGMLAAAVTGFLAMKLLHLLSKKADFSVFSIYCLAVGAIALFLL